jgi:hydroxyethylthiazole kinase
LLINEAVPTVIKGNYSEIYALYRQEYFSSGVDSDESLTVETVEKAAYELAGTLHTTILASGKTDVVTDGKRVTYIRNGSPQLATVTGTGCMQGALCAAFLSVADGYEAAVMAGSMFGICGELAETEKGSGTFMVNLLDRLSTVSDDDILLRLNCEEIR